MSVWEELSAINHGTWEELSMVCPGAWKDDKPCEKTSVRTWVCKKHYNKLFINSDGIIACSNNNCVVTYCSHAMTSWGFCMSLSPW